MDPNLIEVNVDIAFVRWWTVGESHEDLRYFLTDSKSGSCMLHNVALWVREYFLQILHRKTDSRFDIHKHEAPDTGLENGHCERNGSISCFPSSL